MYTLRQAPRHIDDICLCREDGAEEILHVDFRVTEDSVKKYRAAQVELLSLQKSPEPVEEKYTKIGGCINDIFCLLFGAENTKKLFDFYEGDYTTMLQELLPYISEEIVPKFRQAAETRKRAFKKRFRK